MRYTIPQKTLLEMDEKQRRLERLAALGDKEAEKQLQANRSRSAEGYNKLKSLFDQLAHDAEKSLDLVRNYSGHSDEYTNIVNWRDQFIAVWPHELVKKLAQEVDAHGWNRKGPWTFTQQIDNLAEWGFWDELVENDGVQTFEYYNMTSTRMKIRIQFRRLLEVLKYHGFYSGDRVDAPDYSGYDDPISGPRID